METDREVGNLPQSGNRETEDWEMNLGLSWGWIYRPALITAITIRKICGQHGFLQAQDGLDPILLSTL